MAWLRALVVVALAALLSGCADAAPKKASAESSRGTSVLTGTVGDVGTVRGVVLDTERRPIGNATVAFLTLKHEVITDELGRFRFENVPVGTHDVSAFRLGYDTVGKRIQVVAGEESEVNFELGEIAISVGYFHSLPHNALHIAGETYVNWAVNLTGVAPNCEGCVWVDRVAKAPKVMVIEIFGKHTVNNPRGDAEHFWMFRDHYSTNQLLVELIDRPLPIKAVLNATRIEKTKVFWNQLLCENAWVCLQEKRETWITYFFDYREEDVPENFTAKKS